MKTIYIVAESCNWDYESGYEVFGAYADKADAKKKFDKVVKNLKDDHLDSDDLFEDELIDKEDHFHINVGGDWISVDLMNKEIQ